MIQYGIKNFRKFDSAGCEFSLAPITFFTGCNNSGKSSASKSIVLLSQMYKRLESIQEEFSFDDIYLDFSDKSINIGDYDSVMNRKAPKDLGLTFSFSTYSDYIQRNVFVELVFKKRPKEILNRAHLSSFIIRDEQQRCIIKGSDESGEMIICAPDESGLELWLFEQALFEIYFTQQESLPKRQRKEIRALLSDSGKRLRNNRSDIWDLLRSYFGFDDVFDSGAIQDLTTSFKGSGANHYASNLCLLIRSLREQKAPYLDAIDGANKEECIGNIKEMIRNEKDDRTRLLLLRALYSFRKSPFQSLSTFAYNAIKGVRYTAGRFLHPGHSSVWGYTYEALSLRHIGIKVEQEQMNQLRAALKKTLNDNELTDVELSLINKLLFSSNGHDTGEILEAIYSAIGISPAADYYYNPPRIFPGHYLFIRLLGFLLQGLFLPSSRNDLCFSNHDTEKIHFKDFNYIGTTSVSIKRLYSESDNTDLLTSILLKRDFDFSFTNKWLWKLGLGNSLEIVPAPQGIGFFIYIKSNRGGHPVKTLLPDFGQGVSHLLVTLLLVDAWGSKNAMWNHEKNYPTLILEEPEAHLHPSFQSKLADIFLDAYSSYGVQFIIETHSEYLLRRSQVLVANMKFTSNEETEMRAPFHAYYFPKTGKPYSLGYRKDGYFANSFGKGFYDESSSLTFDLL